MYVLLMIDRVKSKSALPREDREVFDIEIDLPGIQAPSEPLPEDRPGNEDDSGAWTDEEDCDDNGVFAHCLEDCVPASGRGTKTYQKQQDYGMRLGAERAHWREQERLLAEAYMEWRNSGPEMEKPGEGISSFVCKVISLEGMYGLPQKVNYYTHERLS
jgi:hypothetical protein